MEKACDAILANLFPDEAAILKQREKFQVSYEKRSFSKLGGYRFAVNTGKAVFPEQPVKILD